MDLVNFLLGKSSPLLQAVAHLRAPTGMITYISSVSLRNIELEIVITTFLALNQPKLAFDVNDVQRAAPQTKAQITA